MSASIRQHAESLVKDFTSEDTAGSSKQIGQAEEDAQCVNRCLVYCRVRPATVKDYEDGAHQLVSVDKKRVVVKDERHYDFDGTFGQQCKQEDIFVQVATPCIQHAFKGFCSALMCYGQTGTGKSFTMCCTKPGIEGVIPRSARHIFQMVANDTARRYTVQGQFIQIYRDQLGDLMSDSGRDKVDIRFEATDGVSLPGCSSHVLTSEEEFMSFYNEGNQRRVVMATAMNPESSRGHSAMVVWIMSEPVDDPCGSKLRGKVTFIDLAGYERFSKTGISNSNAIMKDEAKTINASLLSLGHVVTSLSNGDKHIPWRNSKLTRLLQDSIGGRSRTSIILTIGPSSDHLHETTNSLQFGLRAMAVKVEAKVTVSVDYEKLAAKLQAMLDEKNERINMLEIQIAARDAERSELQERHTRDDENLHERHEEELARLIQEGASEEKIQKLKDVYRAELENLKEQQREEISMQEETYNKEIVTLVAEQHRQEDRRQAEMKLVQERLIEEFQTKLESARGGTNEDLIRAIQQLSEKDTTLASRANDTARLHEHIEALTQQIRDMGTEPLHEAKFPETFLDISQVEELQEKLQGELERQHLKVVELRAQLERATLACNDRLVELQASQSENEQLRLELRNAGITVQATALELATLEQHKAKLIDPVELETLRVDMQSDIDELKSHNDALAAEVEKLKEQAKEQSASVPLTGRVRGLSIARQRPQGLGGAGGAAGAETPRNEVSRALKEQLQQLQDTITRGDRERNSLCQRIADLENKLSEHGVDVEEFGSFCEAPPNRDIAVMIKCKEGEVEALTQMMAKMDQQLLSERTARAFAESENDRLKEQLRASGLPCLSDVAAPAAPPAPVPVEAYHQLLRKIRACSVQVSARLAVRPFDEDPEGLDHFLQEKEDELQMRDELILNKTTECNGLMRAVDTLERQLDALGIVPQCSLSSDHRAMIIEEQQEMETVKEKQNALEDDKRRMQMVLETLKADRAVNANDRIRLEEDLNEAKRRAKDLEDERRQHQERETLFQEQARMATRQMMDAQAKMAASEAQSGIFSKLKRFLK